MKRLRDIAHSRTGDKGNVSQISVIAFDPADFELLARSLTIARIIAHLPELPQPSHAVRYELPLLGALNFVFFDVLSGGVTSSLALDTHGKTLGAQLLDIEIEDV